MPGKSAEKYYSRVLDVILVNRVCPIDCGMAFPDAFPVLYWPKNSHECAGEEFDWFCLDRQGFIAVLTTAGRGPVPDAFFQVSADQYNTIISTMACRKACEIIRVTGESGNLTDWQIYAQHGFFAFDFHDVHRTASKARGGYDLIYRPGCPSHQSELPESVRYCLPVLGTEFSRIDFLPDSLFSLRAEG